MPDEIFNKPLLDAQNEELQAALIQIKRQQAEIAELRDLIEECEWTAPDDMDTAGCCPWCNKPNLTNDNSHKPGCRIAAAIKGEAGRDYLAPADVRVAVQPLVVALVEAKEYLVLASLKTALEHAREKGWCE